MCSEVSGVPGLQIELSLSGKDMVLHQKNYNAVNCAQNIVLLSKQVLLVAIFLRLICAAVNAFIA